METYSNVVLQRSPDDEKMQQCFQHFSLVTPRVLVLLPVTPRPCSVLEEISKNPPSREKLLRVRKRVGPRSRGAVGAAVLRESLPTGKSGGVIRSTGRVAVVQPLGAGAEADALVPEIAGAEAILQNFGVRRRGEFIVLTLVTHNELV